MSKKFLDSKTDENFLYQEIMPSYLILELPSVWKYILFMMIAFVLVLIFIFTFFIIDTFLFIFTLILGIAVILWFGILFTFSAFIRSLVSDRFKIKYYVSENRMIVLNLKTGNCIFNFQIHEISCIESTYNKSKYLSEYNVKKPFAFCEVPCLLISSPCDEYKQLIPVGYSKKTMLELKILISVHCDCS